MSVSVGNNYSGDQFIHIVLDNFRQGGKYTAQMSGHQAELIKEENFTNQKYFSISSPQADYLNICISSGSGRNIERANLVHKKYTFCRGANHYAETVLNYKKG